MGHKFLLRFFKKEYLFSIAAVSLGLLVGIFFGWFIFRVAAKESCISDLLFIKPSLGCAVSDDKSDELSTLQEKLKVLVDGYKNSGKAKRIGLFVRDLNSSRFAGVNDNDVFYMASLLKLPLLIGGYKLAEVEPRIFDQEIKYSGSSNLYDEQIIKPKEQLTLGANYSVKELMRRAIVYSDNEAAQMLFDYYPKEFIDRILQALGLQITRPTGEKENLITPRTYANVFRSLYNASYLTREYADEALSTLTKTTYRNGATAKLPSAVLVAHKFAERTIADPLDPSKSVRQLHECGLVYAKNGTEPYTFCIMTEGANYKELEEVLQDLSLDIYNSMINITYN